MVGDATARDTKSKKDNTKGSAGELSISHILGTSDLLGGGDDPLLDLG